MADRFNKNIIFLSRSVKIIIILSSLLFIIGLFNLYQLNVSKYESSIFVNFPPILIVSFILLFCTGSLLLYVYYKEYNSKLFLLCGILFLSLYFITLISLPIIKGYYLWCMNGDPSTHIGYVNYIVMNNHILPNDFYPFFHIYSTELLIISQIKLESVSMMIPLMNGVFSLIFIYVITNIYINKKSSYFVIIIWATGISGWLLNFTPNAAANLLFPIALYTILKYYNSNCWKWALLTILFIMIYPIFHILPAVALTIFALIAAIKKMIEIRNDPINNKQNSIILPLISVIWIITWTSSFFLWQSVIQNINRLISEQGNVTELDKVTELAQNANMLGYDIYTYFILIYGPITILTLFSFYIFYILYTSDDNKILRTLFVPFLSILALISLLYATNMGFGPLRFQYYIIIISIICLTYFITIQANSKKTLRNVVTNCIIVLLIIFILTASLINIYPTPITYGDNWQTMKSDVTGMDWFFNHKDAEIGITGISFPVGRFADLLYDPIKSNKYYEHSYLIDDDIAFNHFGYDIQESITLKNNINTSYLIINDVDRNKYLTVLPELSQERFNSNDFKQLYYDTAVNKIYNANGFDLYIVNK